MANVEAVPLSQKLFKNQEYFPISLDFGSETIVISKRPKKGDSDVIDLYVGKNHIGMFVEFKKPPKCYALARRELINHMLIVIS